MTLLMQEDLDELLETIKEYLNRCGLAKGCITYSLMPGSKFCG